MGAYDTVELRFSWSVLSWLLLLALVLFLLALPTLARHWQGFHFWSLVVVRTVPPAALVGLVTALIGHRREGRRSTLLAALLHGTLLGSFAVAALVSELG